jgi:hypothetical protein
MTKPQRHPENKYALPGALEPSDCLRAATENSNDHLSFRWKGLEAEARGRLAIVAVILFALILFLSSKGHWPF